jgi:adenylate cyclase
METGLLVDRHQGQITASLCYLAWTLTILGFLDKAMKVSQQVLVWTQSMSPPFPMMLARLYIGLCDQFRGDAQAAEEHSASSLSVGPEYGLAHTQSMAGVIQGWARSCRGDADKGIAEMLSGIAGVEATGIRTPTFLLVPLIQTYLTTGRTDEADRLLGETLETVHQTLHRMQYAELYRLKGELQLKTSGNETEAETCFRRAIEIAQGQNAKWWELRATTSLARLLTRQGRRNEARTMLAEIYNWFTEGFDTADLKDAKALLDESSA